MTGRRLGDRYELVERIGSGGMAEVWRATDRSLGRDVAVKLLHPHLAEDESILARFRSEAQSAARLTHPGIVSIFDTVTTPTTDAIVMELVSGDDLRTILDERGTLAIEDAVEVTMQLAQALGHAHQHGIIHRDIKPANVIVRPDRRVKLSDFGIAKALGDTTLTDSGSLVGTVKYLAPEQIDGRPIDGRTDLYSLSIVLFEMLCGTVPFPSSDLIGAMDRIKRPAPRARTIRPDIPPGVDEFLARSLSRDPNDRPGDAATYAASLSATLRRDSTSVARVADPPPIARPGSTHTIPTGDATPPSPTVRPRSIPMRAPSSPPGPKVRARRRRKRDVIWPVLAATLMIAALVVVWILLRPASNVVTEQLQGNDQLSDLQTGEDEQASTTSTDSTTDTAPSSTAAVTDTSMEDTSTTDAQATIPFTNGIRILAFDPMGDSDEHNAITRLALDGDPSTDWHTQLYNTRRFGGIKEGVGLIIEFEDDTRLSALTTLTNHAGWAARLYEADQPESSLDGWGEPLKFYEGLGTQATLEFPAMTTTSILLWITDLGVPPEADGGETTTTVPTGPSVRLELFELGVVP